MKHSEWMAEAERLLNVMEQLDYKSESYKRCREKLQSHLYAKPALMEQDDFVDSDVWTMTTPSQLNLP